MEITQQLIDEAINTIATAIHTKPWVQVNDLLLRLNQVKQQPLTPAVVNLENASSTKEAT